MKWHVPLPWWPNVGLSIKYQYTVGIIVYTLLSFLKRAYVSRNALNLNFNKLQYEDFTSYIFTFI